MTNTLTGLIPDLQKAAQIVGRERIGLLGSVQLNTGSEAVGLGDTITSFNAPAPDEETITPSMSIPEGTDQTISPDSFIVNNSTSVKIPWRGEEVKSLNNTAYGFSSVYGNQILQAIRKISNTIEAYSCGIAYKGAGAAYGTPGTNPFASDFNAVAEVRQRLADRGCPVDDSMISLIVSGLAGTKLRNQAQLQKANEAGGDDMLRRGTLLDLQGFMLKESAGIQTHTAGTGTGYDVDLVAGYLPGDTDIHVDTGTGTLVVGDAITFSSDLTTKYVTKTGFPGDGDQDLVINSGLLAAVADGEDMAISAAYQANLGLHFNSMEIVVRPYAVPEGGDAAVDMIDITDPWTGITYRVSDYRGYKKALFEIAVVYDAKVWNPDMVCILQG